MTMLSFRVDEAEAAEDDAATWEREPMTAEEGSLAALAEWGPAEEWSDWSDAAK